MKNTLYMKIKKIKLQWAKIIMEFMKLFGYIKISDTIKAPKIKETVIDFVKLQQVFDCCGNMSLPLHLTPEQYDAEIKEIMKRQILNEASNYIEIFSENNGRNYRAILYIRKIQKHGII